MAGTVMFVMAGGKGSRLAPLTVHRAKPAVPFGGRYRIIDFVLSNLVNSGYRRIYVLTQFMASSLIRHLSRNWRLGSLPNEFLEVVPAQMRIGEYWYRGTADAVFQNLNLVRDARSSFVGVFGGDHVYKFAVDQMEDFHAATGADLTIAAISVPVREAHRFGVIEVDAGGRVVAFHEKPKNPVTVPGDPSRCYVSMGNYMFKSEVLQDALVHDAAAEDSSHDFGKDVIPWLLARGADIRTYDFAANRVPGDPEHARPYWRDVGTVDSYVEANMELRSRLPTLNVYNRQWRLRTAQRDYPPARFVRHNDGSNVDIEDSLVCEGTIVESSKLVRCLLGYDCFVHDASYVEDAIMLAGCDVGPGAVLRNVLFDKNVRIEGGVRIGVDLASDQQRFPFISPRGTVVLPKGTYVPRDGPVQFAWDIVPLLESDPATSGLMEEMRGAWEVDVRDRHSHMSAGPRYIEPVPGDREIEDE